MIDFTAINLQLRTNGVWVITENERFLLLFQNGELIPDYLLWFDRKGGRGWLAMTPTADGWEAVPCAEPEAEYHRPLREVWRRIQDPNLPFDLVGCQIDFAWLAQQER